MNNFIQALTDTLNDASEILNNSLQPDIECDNVEPDFNKIASGKIKYYCDNFELMLYDNIILFESVKLLRAYGCDGDIAVVTVNVEDVIREKGI